MTKDYYMLLTQHLLRVCKNDGTIKCDAFIIPAFKKHTIDSLVDDEKNHHKDALKGELEFDPSSRYVYWINADTRADSKNNNIIDIEDISSISLTHGSPLDLIYGNNATMTLRFSIGIGKKLTFYLMKP